MMHAATSRSTLKHNQEVIFLPTCAAPAADGALWRVPVHAWVFERERDSLVRGLALKMLAKALGLAPGEAESELFKERAMAFLVDNKRGRRLSLELGERLYTLASTRRNGHSLTELQIPVGAPKDCRPDAADGVRPLTFRACLPQGDSRLFEGVAYALGAKGWSVVSDIDDTIKVSEVSDRRALLSNTFLKEYQGVAGMSEAYRRWSSAGAAFHYVSASPWQLYEALAKFLRADGFPPGSMHLKQLRWKDKSVIDLFKSGKSTKRAALAPLLAAFPQRSFVLIGDSGEKDLELYGEMARLYPSQVKYIFIRNISCEKKDSRRVRMAFAEVESSKWRLFDGATELPWALQN
jgi:hypothetical protein